MLVTLTHLSYSNKAFTLHNATMVQSLLTYPTLSTVTL